MAKREIMQLIILMNQIVTYAVEMDITWPNVLLNQHAEAHQVKQVDLDEGAMTEQVMNESYKEDKKS